MHETPSSRSSGVPAWQSSTASHVSTPVQTSLSSQRLSVGTLAMPLTGSQLSIVQLTPSSGSSGVPAWQSRTASHVSTPVQTSESSHRLSVGTFAIPVMGSQLSNGATETPSSSIQRCSSLTVEHRIASLGARCRHPLSSQRLSVGTFAIPVMGSQLSTVQRDSIILDSTVFRPHSRAPHRRSPPRCRHPLSSQRLSVGTFAIPVMGSQLSDGAADSIIFVRDGVPA